MTQLLNQAFQEASKLPQLQHGKTKHVIFSDYFCVTIEPKVI
jgi:hypothetical protein